MQFAVCGERTLNGYLVKAVIYLHKRVCSLLYQSRLYIWVVGSHQQVIMNRATCGVPYVGTATNVAGWIVRIQHIAGSDSKDPR
jgi:hypothetical protein